MRFPSFDKCARPARRVKTRWRGALFARRKHQFKCRATRKTTILFAAIGTVMREGEKHTSVSARTHHCDVIGIEFVLETHFGVYVSSSTCAQGVGAGCSPPGFRANAGRESESERERRAAFGRRGARGRERRRRRQERTKTSSVRANTDRCARAQGDASSRSNDVSSS